jgi:hypothetical protein
MRVQPQLSSEAGWRPRLAGAGGVLLVLGGGEAVAGGGRGLGRGAASTGACETSGRPCDPTFPVAGDLVPQYLRPAAPPGRTLCPAEARPRVTLALSEPWVALGVAPRRAPSASGGRPRLFPRPKWGGV